MQSVPTLFPRGGFWRILLQGDRRSGLPSNGASSPVISSILARGPVALHQLTDRSVKTAKSSGKERLVADGGGLYLRVLPTGFRSWLLIYSFDGARRKLALGGARTFHWPTRVAQRLAAREVAIGLDPRVALMTLEAEQDAPRKRLRLPRQAQARSLHLRRYVRRLDEEWRAASRRQRGVAPYFREGHPPRIGDMPVRGVGDTELRMRCEKSVAVASVVVPRNVCCPRYVRCIGGRSRGSLGEHCSATATPQNWSKPSRWSHGIRNRSSETAFSSPRDH